MAAGDANIAARISEIARQQPSAAAIITPSPGSREGGGRVTYGRLEEGLVALAHGLLRIGVRRGMRVIVMLPPGAAFFESVFALMRIGAVPVLIDPGIGRRGMADSLSRIDAKAFIGVPLAQVLRILHRGSFRTIAIVVTAGRRWLWGGHRYEDVHDRGMGPLDPADVSPDDTAAILFTSGSTGPPKGVVYRYETFDAQVRLLREQFGLSPEDTDLATFPLFALFDAALGASAVLPRMDFSRPGHVDARVIVQALEAAGCSRMFGSPALLDRVASHAGPAGVRLPRLRRVITAGAPVRPDILERFSRLLGAEAEIVTPYGATEALPVAVIGHREILDDTAHRTARGAGTCVGRPVDGVAVRIIRISDDVISTWRDDLELPRGQIGEMVVKGPIVTHAYFADPAATARAKIHEGDAVWHRMGDVGYFDERGRLWFCGRKSQRVETEAGVLFTDPLEGIFNALPQVRRSALVGVGERPRQQAVMCLELAGSMTPGAQLRAAMAGVHERDPMTRPIRAVLVHPGFPVDVRHNAKIFRERLGPWAARRIDAPDMVL